MKKFVDRNVRVVSLRREKQVVRFAQTRNQFRPIRPTVSPKRLPEADKY